MDAIEQLLKAHAVAGSKPGAAEAICRSVLQAEPENGFACICWAC